MTDDMLVALPNPVSGTALMPAFALAQAVERRNDMIRFVQTMMKKDTHFGVVPGTGSKPTLYKAGAEMLCSFFGLVPVFQDEKVTEDWTGSRHGGEPFFYYRRRCELWRNGVLLGSASGSCNSWEPKYRYRSSERMCPMCGEAAIIKGQEKYGGGWLCFKKKGGCGAKFDDADPTIVNQEVGRIANPDIASQVNTLLKMADKRAFVAAILIVTNASEFFTQDLEDMYVDADYVVVDRKTGEIKAPTAIDTEGELYEDLVAIKDTSHMGNPVKRGAVVTVHITTAAEMKGTGYWMRRPASKDENVSQDRLEYLIALLDTLYPDVDMKIAKVTEICKSLSGGVAETPASLKPWEAETAISGAEKQLAKSRLTVNHPWFPAPDRQPSVDWSKVPEGISSGEIPHSGDFENVP